MSQTPKNFVRLCRRRNDFLQIINEASNYSSEQWEQDLVKSVIKHIIGEERSGISVYNTETLEPFDEGHALAVIAEGIAQNEFRATANKRKPSCTRGTLIIPISCLPASTSYELTPENNLDFYPANSLHFDLTVADPDELAITILNGIKQRLLGWTFLGNENHKETYRLQAVIAYSHCLRIFGKLDPDAPPHQWKNGKNLTASQQIEILKYLAQIQQVDSPNPF